MFLPFFIVQLFGLFEFSLSKGIQFCCSLAVDKCVGKSVEKFVKKIVKKFDLLFFLGEKDVSGKGKEKLLCLNSAKVKLKDKQA